MGAETGKFHESPESRASKLACELRRVDEAIDMLERGLWQQRHSEKLF